MSLQGEATYTSSQKGSPLSCMEAHLPYLHPDQDEKDRTSLTTLPVRSNREIIYLRCAGEI